MLQHLLRRWALIMVEMQAISYEIRSFSYILVTQSRDLVVRHRLLNADRN